MTVFAARLAPRGPRALLGGADPASPLRPAAVPRGRPPRRGVLAGACPRAWRGASSAGPASSWARSWPGRGSRPTSSCASWRPAYPAAAGASLPASALLVAALIAGAGGVALVRDGARLFTTLAVLSALVLAIGFQVALPAFGRGVRGARRRARGAGRPRRGAVRHARRGRPVPAEPPLLRAAARRRSWAGRATRASRSWRPAPAGSSSSRPPRSCGRSRAPRRALRPGDAGRLRAPRERRARREAAPRDRRGRLGPAAARPRARRPPLSARARARDPAPPAGGEVRAGRARDGSRGPWLVAHLFGEIYPDKPPLYFWADRDRGRAPGRTARRGVGAAARGRSAASRASSSRCALGEALFGRRAGLVSATVLATSGLFFWYARQGHPDQFLIAAVTLACLGLWRSFTSPRGPRRTAWIALAYAAMALGVMSKGLLGLVLPLLAGVLYLALTGPLRAVPRRLGLWPGLLVFVAVVLAWYGPAVARYGVGYLRETIVHQQVERYARSWVHHGPWYQYLGDFATGFLPWSLFVPGALALAWQAWRGATAPLREARAADTPDGQAPAPFLFPLCWFVSGFVFFSLSTGKRAAYLLPLYPAAALLVGWLWAGRSRRGGARAGSRCRSRSSRASPPSRRGSRRSTALGVLVLPRRLHPRPDGRHAGAGRSRVAGRGRRGAARRGAQPSGSRGGAAGPGRRSSRSSLATAVCLLGVTLVRAPAVRGALPGARARRAHRPARAARASRVLSLLGDYDFLVAFYLDRPIAPLPGPSELLRRARRPPRGSRSSTTTTGPSSPSPASRCSPRGASARSASSSSGSTGARPDGSGRRRPVRRGDACPRETRRSGFPRSRGCRRMSESRHPPGLGSGWSASSSVLRLGRRISHRWDQARRVPRGGARCAMRSGVLARRWRRSVRRSGRFGGRGGRARRRGTHRGGRARTAAAGDGAPEVGDELYIRCRLGRAGSRRPRRGELRVPRRRGGRPRAARAREDRRATRDRRVLDAVDARPARGRLRGQPGPEGRGGGSTRTTSGSGPWRCGRGDPCGRRPPKAAAGAARAESARRRVDSGRSIGRADHAQSGAQRRRPRRPPQLGRRRQLLRSPPPRPDAEAIRRTAAPPAPAPAGQARPRDRRGHDGGRSGLRAKEPTVTVRVTVKNVGEAVFVPPRNSAVARGHGEDRRTVATLAGRKAVPAARAGGQRGARGRRAEPRERRRRGGLRYSVVVIVNGDAPGRGGDARQQRGVREGGRVPALLAAARGTQPRPPARRRLSGRRRSQIVETRPIAPPAPRRQ